MGKAEYGAKRKKDWNTPQIILQVSLQSGFAKGSSVTARETTPYDWLKQVPSSLLKWDRVPLTGNGPQFPWDAFSNHLAKLLDVDILQIKPTQIEWRGGDTVMSDIPNSCSLAFAASGIAGSLIWAVSEADLNAFINIVVKNKAPPFSLENSLRNSFLQFFGIEALEALRHSGFDTKVTFQQVAEIPQIDEEALCIDIEINLNHHCYSSRLIVPPTFRQSWIDHYADNATPYQQRQLSSAIDVTTHFEIGKTTIQQAEWLEVATGDFLLLDSCSYNPETGKGRALLTALGRPLFRCKLKGHVIKILEIPQLYEAKTSMEEQPDDQNEEEILEEELFDDDALPPLKEEFFDDDENAPSKKSSQEEEDGEELPVASPPLETSPNDEIVPIEEIPLTLAVEVGRLQLSLQKLMELEPGNLIELNVAPSDGVDLIAEGKRVARGELLKVGDVLGVRILEKG